MPLRLRPALAQLLLLLASGCLLGAENPPSQADLRRLSQAIERVEKQLSEATTEREQLQQAVFDSEREVAELASAIRSLDEQISEESQQLDSLQQQANELDARRQQQADTIARYLRSAWQSGQQEYIKLLLNQEDVALASRMQHYYRDFNAARADRIAEFAGLMADVEANAQALTASTFRLGQAQAELQQQQVALQKSQDKRRLQLTSLEKVLSQGGQELARLQQEREELTLLIEEINRSIAALQPPASQEPFAGMQGKLPWPVTGRLLNSFGTRHELGDVTWQGVNIAAAAGSEVRAIHSGRVVFADWFGNSGLLLIIDHGDGFMSLYAQNEQLLRGVGDWVNGGDVIAAVGSTGGREDPALYFEIRRDGRSQDPVAWCLPRR